MECKLDFKKTKQNRAMNRIALKPKPRRIGEKSKAQKTCDSIKASNDCKVKPVASKSIKVYAPLDYWSIYSEKSALLRFIHEASGIGIFELADGSVNRNWRRYRSEQFNHGASWICRSETGEYYFSEKKFSCLVSVYSNSEKPYFDNWFNSYYKTCLLWEFLKDKKCSVEIIQKIRKNDLFND
ncbi:UNVERIFIED_CONTAM: hypothetical protein BEN50_11840 [Euhalothece sp. KZN 001]